jgi:hypothetical protein
MRTCRLKVYKYDELNRPSKEIALKDFILQYQIKNKTLEETEQLLLTYDLEFTQAGRIINLD